MKFYWPLDTVFITQHFGRKSKAYPLGYHMGVDLRCKRGTDVYSAQNGKVVKAKYLPPFDGYGCHIVIDHGNNMFSIYAHLDSVNVKVGDVIKAHQLIGKTGGNPRDYGAKTGNVKVNGAFTKAGNSSGYHLHYEIDKNGISPRYSINPEPITFTYDLSMATPIIPPWAKDVSDKSKKKGLINDWSNPVEIVASEKAEWIFEKLGLLDPKKHEGGINLARFAIIVDKLGLIDKLPDIS
jgi:hypothetical protein